MGRNLQKLGMNEVCGLRAGLSIKVTLVGSPQRLTALTWSTAYGTSKWTDHFGDRFSWDPSIWDFHIESFTDQIAENSLSSCFQGEIILFFVTHQTIEPKLYVESIACHRSFFQVFQNLKILNINILNNILANNYYSQILEEISKPISSAKFD